MNCKRRALNDSGEAIGQVATGSHAHHTRGHIVDGVEAERMQSGAGAAAASLIDKYRWSLFTIGSDTNATLASMAGDAMTWDSLIQPPTSDSPNSRT